MIDFKKQTALFGGSFDPIHSGHLHVADEVLRQLPFLDQIVFVPAFQSPGKALPVANGAARVEWLKIVVNNPKFSIWTEELERGGESFTVDTLEKAAELGAEKKNLHFIMGGDAYGSFSQWRNPGRIRTLANLIVVNRPGHEISKQIQEDRILTIVPHPASSTEIRHKLSEGIFCAEGVPPALAAHWEKTLRSNNPYARKKI